MRKANSPSAGMLILPLKDPVILYIDDNAESRQAQELLAASGIRPFVTDGAVEPLQRKPLLLHHGSYQGLDEIRNWLSLLAFWSREHPDFPDFHAPPSNALRHT